MHLNRSEYAQATDYYQQLRNQAEKSSDQIHLRIAFNGLGITASRTGIMQLPVNTMSYR